MRMLHTDEEEEAGQRVRKKEEEEDVHIRTRIHRKVISAAEVI